MRTKQHNLNPVERTIGASGLMCGLFGQLGRQAAGDSVNTDPCLAVPADPARPSQPDTRCVWLVTGQAAGDPGLRGSSAEYPGHPKLS